MRILFQIILSGVAIYFTAWLLPGVSVTGFGTAIIVAIVLGTLNVTLKPILQLLSLPVTLITLGLFLPVINTVIILLTSRLIGGFHVENFWWALLFSLIASGVTSLLKKTI
ncbi:MAG: phage holin family protein [Prevotellaceae bacterium]|jgi:putative membrane protein|nr:phage holin family protein [Prevotellaceae bacterium]